MLTYLLPESEVFFYRIPIKTLTYTRTHSSLYKLEILYIRTEVVMAKEVKIIGLESIPEIKTGDDIAKLIVEATEREGVGIRSGDIVVVASKIIAKAEGRVIYLDRVVPSKRAIELSNIVGKDPRLVEIILRESRRVIKATRGHLIVETKHGIVCANAGVDKSNVAGREDIVLTLPIDPDRSAREIRYRLYELTGCDVAVVVSDTQGRPLREGQIDVAIGVSGINIFRDYRGTKDLKGYTLKIKRIAIVDEIASAAELVMGNGSEGVPVAIIRGLLFSSKEESAKLLNMPKERWLFK